MALVRGSLALELYRLVLVDDRLALVDDNLELVDDSLELVDGKWVVYIRHSDWMLGKQKAEHGEPQDKDVVQDLASTLCLEQQPALQLRRIGLSFQK